MASVIQANIRWEFRELIIEQNNNSRGATSREITAVYDDRHSMHVEAIWKHIISQVCDCILYTNMQTQTQIQTHRHIYIYILSNTTPKSRLSFVPDLATLCFTVFHFIMWLWRWRANCFVKLNTYTHTCMHSRLGNYDILAAICCSCCPMCL